MSDKSSAHFRTSRVAPGYWRVTFENPPINMLEPKSYLELQALAGDIEKDSELKVIVFDSADPDFFVAHFDISRNVERSTVPGPTGYPPWLDFLIRIARAPVISIAAIRGRTRGVGSEFALGLDLRFASIEKAIFCQPEVGVGLIPGGGAIERLPLLTGRARALEIMIGAEDFDAVTAERYGWINRAIPDAELDVWVDRFARRIASFDKEAIMRSKELINRHTLPDPNDQVESQNIFQSAFGWPGFRDRAPRLVANGLGKRSDLELNLGRQLG